MSNHLPPGIDPEAFHGPPPVRPHPRTDAVANAIGASGIDWHHSATLMRRHANSLETEITALRKELAETIVALQKECDHTWEKVDGRFDSDRGVGGSVYMQCEKCGKTAEPGDVPHPDEDGCDDGPRDAREEARLDP